MIKVSIIIPVYGVEAYIEKCLQSIMSQTMTEGVECIIVNDCTLDNSMSIATRLLSNYHGKIIFKIINHNQNKGLALSRNTGVIAARGEYILHIDSDDFCNHNMVERMYTSAITHKADIVIADFYKTYSHKEQYIRNTSLQNSSQCIAALLEGKMHPAVWNKLIKRELIIKNKLYNVPNGNCGEDYFLTVRLFHYTSNIYFLHEAFVHYIQYNTASYTKNINKKALESHLLVSNEILKFLKEKGTYKIYKKSFWIGQVDLKATLLANTKGIQQKLYNEMLPETKKINIIFKSNVSLKTKIALTAAGFNLLLIYNFIQYLIKKGRNIKQKIYHI